MSNLVAVFQIGSLGDSIVSVPTLLSIREFVPGCSEYLLVSRFDSKLKVLPADIFEMAWKPKKQLNYSSPEGRLLQLYTVPSLLAKLRYYRPKYCVSLMPSDREPERVERDRQFFKAGGIKELLGFKTMPRLHWNRSADVNLLGTEAYRKFSRLWGESSSQKFPRYARVPVIQPDPAATRRVGQWLRDNRLDAGKRLIAISPYSNYSSKDIPDATLFNLIPRLAKLAGAEVVMVGGLKDSARAQEILGVTSGLNACGVFSVQESAALLKACSLAICTDTGPMHLAAAVGVPLLVTFSRISKQFCRWLPFGQRSTILYREVDCAGCDAVQCSVPGHPCMEDITADQILTSAMNILKGLPVSEIDLPGTKVLTW
jgi:ADP-heptose:LPS heptosyltransferase